MEMISQVGEVCNKLFTKKNIANFIWTIIMIMISILLANEIDSRREHGLKEKSKMRYLQMMRADICESMIDMERDLNGHILAYQQGLILDSIIYNKGELSTELQWEYLLSDFQFYPNLSTFESFKYNNFDFTNKRDTIYRKVISLFELDFGRLVSFGKDKSNTKNIKDIWKSDITNLFDLDTVKLYSRIEGLQYDTTIINGKKLPGFRKNKLILKERLSKKERKRLLLNIQATNEIRLIKINYYAKIKDKSCQIVSEIDSIIKKRLGPFGNCICNDLK